ncbi:N-acetylmuramoyl-L-alanine amidase AmiD [Sodalis praecaptivus]|uniref:N-acetylmuramoyl-L-alanine amidase n=1 Tax=Sodalis praecaptivus TaxID=1239307 RepID=UPI002800105B|nr:N-acetylmuramoyl-L-alanine amidase [Sodalis praecaptivus]CAJ0991431.1 N-acetylmuramoyl-L-alanine amidase AmiD [Sodalis praecaptivus]
MYPIDATSYRSVKGFNQRVRFLIMHYTALNFANSVNALSGDATLSAHYLVPDPDDQSYIDAGFNDMRIFNLVDEKDRAWHAGLSAWAGRNNLNDTSIGIENVNLASVNAGKWTFPPYPAVQVEAIIQLAQSVLQRYPDITPTQVVGHSDVAPGRKFDPGAAFPWRKLYEAGIGAWFDDATKQQYSDEFAEHGTPDQAAIKAKLKTYGYNVAGATGAGGYKNLIQAFQLHFRPADWQGTVDNETAAILYALVDKYFNK